MKSGYVGYYYDGWQWRVVQTFASAKDAVNFLTRRWRYWKVIYNGRQVRSALPPVEPVHDPTPNWNR